MPLIFAQAILNRLVQYPATLPNTQHTKRTCIYIHKKYMYIYTRSTYINIYTHNMATYLVWERRLKVNVCTQAKLPPTLPGFLPNYRKPPCSVWYVIGKKIV